MKRCINQPIDQSRWFINSFIHSFLHHVIQLFENPKNISTQLFFSVTLHYSDVIMTMMASQITSLTVVYSIVYSDADQRKHQSSVSLAFVRGIHRWPVNSPHKGPVTRKMFPFDDVIMSTQAPIVFPAPQCSVADNSLIYSPGDNMTRLIHLSRKLVLLKINATLKSRRWTYWFIRIYLYNFCLLVFCFLFWTRIS